MFPSVVGIGPVNWFEPRSNSSRSVSDPKVDGIVEKKALSANSSRPDTIVRVEVVHVRQIYNRQEESERARTHVRNFSMDPSSEGIAPNIELLPRFSASVG